MNKQASLKLTVGRYLKKFIALSLTFVLVFSMIGCGNKPESDSGGKKSPEKQKTYGAFAEFYKEPEFKVAPSLKPYTVKKDLSNVSNANDFVISDDIQELLVKNGFAAAQSYYPQFFQVYEGNKYSGIPNFVTVDSMLHTSHLYFDYLLSSVEEEFLFDELLDLSHDMLEESLNQYKNTKDNPSFNKAALRNIAFFGVGAKLLDPRFKVPADAEEQVSAELKLIEAHSGIITSPMMAISAPGDKAEPYLEDYSQYVPRGHYTQSDVLKNYFKAMMWYGRMNFRFAQDSEAKSALLMTLALKDSGAVSYWDKIYQVTSFFAGVSDDPGYPEMSVVIADVYGEDKSLKEIMKDEEAWKNFISKAKAMKPAAVNSMVVGDPSIDPDREEVTEGFRLMGQRYTLDADIFQRLIFREVKANKAGEKRMLPSSLDVPAAMGSEIAKGILKAEGNYGYENYENNLNSLGERIRGLDEKEWQQTLYQARLNCLRPLIEPLPDGYPSFMKNRAWELKSLTTFLGSFTELKHDTILYSKQVYAEMGGPGPEEPAQKGYVEPNPLAYARIVALTAMTRDGLESLEMLNEKDKENLNKLEELSLNLMNISIKELQNESLTKDDIELINSFGGQLEHFWLESIKNSDQMDYSELLINHPAMIVADVATDPDSGQVLELATGHIQNIYAIVPLEGKLWLVSGGMYSAYQFPWPMEDRLTDEAWREMVDNLSFDEKIDLQYSFINEYMVMNEDSSFYKNYDI